MEFHDVWRQLLSECLCMLFTELSMLFRNLSMQLRNLSMQLIFLSMQLTDTKTSKGLREGW